MIDKFWEDGEETPKPKPEPKAIDGLGSIIQLFDRAALHLSWPKIRFGKLTLVRCGTGAVMIKNNDARAAWIQKDGSLHQSKYRPLSDNLVNFLAVFAKDPAKYSALEGIRSGRCCFCGRKLTNPKSVTVGYGPTCAEHYSLPYGEQSFVNEPTTIENLEGGQSC